MEVLNIVGGIVVLGLLLWLNYYIAKQFEAAANEKGYYGRRFFHLCFWLGAVGYFLVIALPDRGKTSIGINTADELPDL